MPTVTRVTTRTARQAIENREPFTTSGSMWGGHPHDRHIPYGGTGCLPSPYREQYVNAIRCDDRHEMYVVYSYATPIAWWTPNTGWTVPPVKYSRTTTKHQGNLPRDGLF